jgi:hypothetical protein
MDSDFNGLQVMARRLNELSNSILQTIKHIDMRLAPINAGIEVFLEEPLAHTNDGALFRLGYGKVPDDVPDERIEIRCLDDNQWCLLIKLVQSPDREDGPDNVTSDREKPVKIYPLVQASRDLRILGLKRVPELVEALKVKVARCIHEIQKSTKELSSFVSVEAEGVGDPTLEDEAKEYEAMYGPGGRSNVRPWYE